MRRLSVIVPCYNEEAVIKFTDERIRSAIPNHAFDLELIYINDGSRDGTLIVLDELAARDPQTKVIHFARNFGHQSAVSAGLDFASGDFVAIIDGDLQDPPEAIPEMIKLLENSDAQIVYGQRAKRKGESTFKIVTAFFFYRILNALSEIRFPLDTGDFRVVTKKVIDTFRLFPEREMYLRGLFSWMGFKQIPYEYVRDKRFAGETGYTLKKMIKLALTGILGFSTKPLRIAMNIGFLTFILSAIFGLWILITALVFPQKLISGWASTIVVILLLGGIQLMSIGILGEYLGKVFEEMKGRPKYVIVQTRNCDL